jgi:HD-GYP domain-containing protein (c-di-GMP phosphodiesterase class II)
MAVSTEQIALDAQEVAHDHAPVRLNSVRADRIAGFDIYIQPGPNNPLTLYCRRNTIFSEEARQRLIENGIAQLYIAKNQRREYARYIEKHLSEIVADNAISAEEKSEILYAAAGGVVEDVLFGTDLVDGVKRTKEIVTHAVTAVLTSSVRLAHFLKVNALGYQVPTHSVNVATYSVFLAQRAGYADPASLREIANGSLLHDVGKSKISPRILSSKEPLTRQEWEELERHPVYSYEILRETSCLGEIALDIVLHHHEKLSGGGYPDGLSGDSISPFVRIVTISDTFDALTTERPFQPACSSFVALNRMRLEMDADLDKDLFRAFVGMMGPQRPNRA